MTLLVMVTVQATAAPPLPTTLLSWPEPTGAPVFSCVAHVLLSLTESYPDTARQPERQRFVGHETLFMHLFLSGLRQSKRPSKLHQIVQLYVVRV